MSLESSWGGCHLSMLPSLLFSPHGTQYGGGVWEFSGQGHLQEVNSQAHWSFWGQLVKRKLSQQSYFSPPAPTTHTHCSELDESL